MSEEYETVLLVKNDLFVYKIPPRLSTNTVKASDWKLDEPDWTCRMRLIAIGNKCVMKIEDKASGQLFAKCPIDEFPSVSFEPVADSSRYFVIRVVNDDGRAAFLGIGFADRSDAFDLNVALQDHFKWVNKVSELEKAENDEANEPKLDLKFKEGQTIKVNINIAKKSGTPRERPKMSGNVGILPPPPASMKIPAPSASASAAPPQAESSKKDDAFGAFVSSSPIPPASSQVNSNWTTF